MIVAPLVVILCITGVGVGIHRFTKYWSRNLSINELIINSLILSSGLLIIPLTIFGLYDLPILFSSWIYIYATISIFSYILFFYIGIRFILFNNKLSISKINPNFLIIVLLGLMIFSIYVIYAIILPLRGYDALWMYLPDALWYYQTDSIPLFNILNFRPAVKEPIPSLFFTFSLYITTEFSINFIPLIFFLAWSLLAVEFVKLLWPTYPRYLQWFIWPLFLAFPLNIWFMDNWAYYQDIFLGFFFSCALYYYFKLFYNKNVTNRYYYYVLIIFSISLAFFTKISAWYLILLFILLLPGDKRVKSIQILVSLVLFLFLGAQLAFRSYVGYIFIIAILYFFVVYNIWTKKEIILKKSQIILNLTTILLGVLLGGIWLFENLNRYSEVSDLLLDSYFNVVPLIKSTFVPNTLSSPGFILETTQSADFFAGILLLFIGNYFALFWLIPKLRSIFKNNEIPEVFIWITCTFALWLTYYHIGSQRYLTPIILPLIIIVYKGILMIWEDLTLIIKKFTTNQSIRLGKNIPLNFLLLFLVLGLLTLYFPLPLETILGLNSSDSSIGHLYLESAYSYYKNWFLLIIIAIILPLFILLSIIFLNSRFLTKSNFHTYRSKFGKIGTLSLVLLIFLIPTIVPTMVLVSSNLDINRFQQEYVYENRQAVEEIREFLGKNNVEKQAVLVLNTPGIPVWTSIPSIDFISQSDLLTPLYDNKNITYGLNLLLNPLLYTLETYDTLTVDQSLIPGVKYILIPNKENFIFEHYLNYYKHDSYLFSIIYDSRYFNEVFRNIEFVIYERIFSVPSFIGPFDVRIDDSTSKNSIIGEIVESIELNSNFTLTAHWDLSNLKGSNIMLNNYLKIKNLVTGKFVWLNSSTSGENKDFSVFQSSDTDLPNYSFEISDLILEVSYTDELATIKTSIWNYELQDPVILRNQNSKTSIERGLGLSLSSSN
ncbi:MAG: hypothetical protein ACXACX_13440 [Candidatus Hodarchaeales archaeon]|jgi:hypothetical protein